MQGRNNFVNPVVDMTTEEKELFIQCTRKAAKEMLLGKTKRKRDEGTHNKS